MTDYEFIDLNLIAYHFNQLLGFDYSVNLFSADFVAASDKRTQVTFQAKRRPIGVDGVKSETLDIVLNFRVNVLKKTQVLKDIQKLLGFQTYTISNVGESELTPSFYINSYLSLDIPYGTPVNDCGEIKADYTVTGTMLVSNREGGGYISNFIETKISFKNNYITYEDKLMVLNSRIKPAYTTDSPVKLGNEKGGVRIFAKIYAATVTCFNLNREIDRFLLKAITGDVDISEIKLTRSYNNNGVIEDTAKEYMIIDGSIDENAGAFQTYSLTLQEL